MALQCPEQQGCKVLTAAGLLVLSAWKNPKGFGSPPSSPGATLPAQASPACGHPGEPLCTGGLRAPTNLQPPHSLHCGGPHPWVTHTTRYGKVTDQAHSPCSPQALCVYVFGVGIPKAQAICSQ